MYLRGQKFSMVQKEDVIQLLEEIAFMLDLLNENQFKIRAYHNASRAISVLEEDINTIVAEKRLGEIPGIGEALTEKITEFVTTGKLDYLEELKKKIPEGLLQMLRIQGLGPRKVKKIYDTLKITTLEDLAKACQGNKIAVLEGFGEKTQANILRGIGFLQEHSGQYLYSAALAWAEEIVAELKKIKDVQEITVAGSLRRVKELVKDIDILVSAERSEKIVEKFVTLPNVEAVNAQGDTKAAITLKSGINVDLRVIKPKEFAHGLQHFSGSKEHNVVLRGLAKKLGYKMNEYGLFKGEKNLLCKSEAEIYAKLGLSYIPPELRENTGEIEAAEKNLLPELLDIKDIKGLFHLHTSSSDGENTLAEMAEACQKLGFQYMVVTEHSQTAYYAGGLTLDKIKKQHAEIDKFNNENKKFYIFKGIESEILHDGELDYPDEILAKFDFVIGSIHSSFKMSEDQMTKRIIKAMKNKYFKILGHPTGRLLLEREPYQINMEKIISTAAEYGKAIEINCNPRRFDLDWRWCKRAKELGVKIVLSPDAHRREGLSDIHYGVGLARKGWLEKGDVLNCLTTSGLKKYCRS